MVVSVIISLLSRRFMNGLSNRAHLQEIAGGNCRICEEVVQIVAGGAEFMPGLIAQACA
jgi:hypothetical protein